MLVSTSSHFGWVLSLVRCAIKRSIWLIFRCTIGISHNLDCMSLGPSNSTFFCLSVITTFSFENVTSQSPSHNTGIDTNGFFISSNTVAFFNAGGRVGICSSLVATDVIVVLLAHHAIIGSCGNARPGQCEADCCLCCCRIRIRC